MGTLEYWSCMTCIFLVIIIWRMQIQINSSSWNLQRLSSTAPTWENHPCKPPSSFLIERDDSQDPISSLQPLWCISSSVADLLTEWLGAHKRIVTNTSCKDEVLAFARCILYYSSAVTQEYFKEKLFQLLYVTSSALLIFLPSSLSSLSSFVLPLLVFYSSPYSFYLVSLCFFFWLIFCLSLLFFILQRLSHLKHTRRSSIK
jgi:hypothetical protein